MTREDFMRLYRELDELVLDLRRSDAAAVAAIEAFEQREDIPADWRAEASWAARRSLEMREPDHLASQR